jgi:CubicO group peptidase (beta-lactamase class C family)
MYKKILAARAEKLFGQTDASLEDEIPRLMTRASIPGLSIAVIRDGEIVLTKGFGVKSTKTKKPVSTDTIFEAASLSKPLFAYAVLKANELEKINLDLDTPLVEKISKDTINKYLGKNLESFDQEFQDRLSKITPRMLLSHTSGLPNWRGKNPLSIAFEPGKQWSYSGEGFCLLGLAVQKLSGLEFNAFMKKLVLDPLGMTSSSYTWREDFLELSASPHIDQEAMPKNRPSDANPAASLHTTAGDYAKFILAMIQNTTLSKIMRTPQKNTLLPPEVTRGIPWGLGFGLQQIESKDGTIEPSFWHWGDNGPFKAFVMGDSRNAFVYFANSLYGLRIWEDLAQNILAGKHSLIEAGVLSHYKS